MKRLLLSLVIAIAATQAAFAQYDFLRPVKDSIPGGYDFWVYTPQDYYYSLEATPVVIFLHGRSLCGRNLSRVRRYGPLDAIVKGRQIEALVIVPQNTGGAWDPDKINDVLEWTKRHYAMDSTRVYVMGMSLGGYGTLDFAGTYPDKVAAAMALCGGTTLNDTEGLGRLPLWIMHGTADRAVPISQSKKVVEAIKESGGGRLLRYDWVRGASHGDLARLLYLKQTYDWLFAHTTADSPREVDRDVTITKADLKNAYTDLDPKATRFDIVKEIKPRK